MCKAPYGAFTGKPLCAELDVNSRITLVQMADETKKLNEHVNKSGFPLQIGLSNLVDDTTAQHGWKVVYTEHAWRNELSGTDGFVDLVLEDRHTTSVLVVECKRVLNSTWTFLLHGKGSGSRRHGKGWLTRAVASRVTSFNWQNLVLDPQSAESQYCVVPGQDPKGQPMLERTAAEVVDATEAIAAEDRPFVLQKPDSIRAATCYVPCGGEA